MVAIGLCIFGLLATASAAMVPPFYRFAARNAGAGNNPMMQSGPTNPMANFGGLGGMAPQRPFGPGFGGMQAGPWGMQGGAGPWGNRMGFGPQGFGGPIRAG